MPDTAPTTVAVAVSPATSSKINWTQIISAAAMLLSFMSGGKIGLTPEQQAAVAVTIGLLSNVVTVIFRTWFSKTVTPASVANANTTTTLATPVAHIT